jgi:UBA/TS-N domain
MPASSATSAIASESTTHSRVVHSRAEPTPEVTQETTTSSRNTSDSISSSGDLLSGDNLQGAINNIVDMGFPRDQVMRAMRASFNNADRAVEYLMTVSAFITFSGCFIFIYHFSRDSPIPKLMFLRKVPTPQFRPQFPL